MKQEAFEKCWAHSPLRAAARRIAIHQVSLLSHAATVARRLRIDVHNNNDDNNNNNDNAWQRGPLWPHRMGPINCSIQQPTHIRLIKRYTVYVSIRLSKIRAYCCRKRSYGLPETTARLIQRYNGDVIKNDGSVEPKPAQCWLGLALSQLPVTISESDQRWDIDGQDLPLSSRGAGRPRNNS